MRARGGNLFGAGASEKRIIRQLNGELVRILQLPEARERFAGLGIEPAGGTPEQLATQIREELARWTPIVKRADIKGE